jgi:glycosyltransferase involved in cell wall biosynthesis
VEIIVIDDGSNDNSRKVIQQFSGRIRWEAAGSNQGVNRTRNRGISLASGEFVLFLDADDFLEPDTVFRQVELLEDRAADICYADWKYWMMRPKGSWQSKPHNGKRSPGDDLTVSLLKDWWCPPFAYLYRKRFILENNLFWNENLGFPDDFEYILKASLKQPAVVYHPVVTGYYRKHIGSRLSGITTEKWAKNVVFIYELAEDQLRNQNRWKEPYIDAVCSGYLGVGRRMFKYDPNFFQQMLDKIHQLKPNFCASRKRYRWAAQILGYERAERLAQLKRRGRAMIEALVCKVRG